MTFGDVATLLGIVGAIGAAFASWGSMRQQVQALRDHLDENPELAAVREQLRELQRSRARQGRRIGRLEADALVRAALEEQAGSTRRPTSPMGLAIGTDESGEHEE